MQALLARGADSDTIRETLLWNFHDFVEAAFLLANDEGMLEGQEGKRDIEYEVPAGLFS